jgi:hypothetical protein
MVLVITEREVSLFWQHLVVLLMKEYIFDLVNNYNNDVLRARFDLLI